MERKNNECLFDVPFNLTDFAILQGPPGSGTTAIIELIAQCALQNKRVLLCGSTQASIDNVLTTYHFKTKSCSISISNENRSKKKEFMMREFTTLSYLSRLFNTLNWFFSRRGQGPDSPSE